MSRVHHLVDHRPPDPNQISIRRAFFHAALASSSKYGVKKTTRAEKQQMLPRNVGHLNTFTDMGEDQTRAIPPSVSSSSNVCYPP